MREVIIRDGTIRLGQFLKLADLIEGGGDAKALLARDAVTVNGEAESRRGRQLTRGDVVRVDGADVRVG
jgi:ribosome-associated protein